MVLPALPATFASTRESLRALACYVVSPARKARTGRIGLRPVGDGFGTPAFDDGTRIVVRGDELAFHPGPATTITTLRAGTAFVGIHVSPDPGVGHDLPPYAPDEDLAVDRQASLVLGGWYSFGQRVLDDLAARWSAGTVSEAQLWPEHFDLAVTADLDDGSKVNVGFSPGDSFSTEPYVYVGPHRTEGFDGPYWNAPFGAFLPYAELTSEEVALAFVLDGLGRVVGDDFMGPASSSLDMSTHPDLRPAARRMASLVEAVPDDVDVLGHRTPCEGYTVGDLLDHIGGFALAFAAAARKRPLEGGPSGKAANLGADWRDRIPRHLLVMGDAWQDPEAWAGMTRAGGVDLPGEVAGVVALDELVIHGWDLAKATSKPADYDGPGLEAVHDMVQHFRSSGVEGLFGPAVPVADDAPLLDRILGLAGRDPGWEPSP